MRDKLFALDENNTPICVAIIGCGRFGSMMVSQIMRAPGMRLSVICDIDIEKAKASLVLSSGGSVDFVTTTTLSKANHEIENGRIVVTEDVDVAIQSNVDVIVEATGNPDVGSRNIFNSIMHGRHVVNVTVEADALVGPFLKKLADKVGVVYSLVYGDQPGNIEELYDWALSNGFEVIAAGKGTRYIPEFRKGNYEQALSRYGIDNDESSASELNPQMYNSFQDGTKSAIEMCAVSNMTGLIPDIPGMHQPSAGIDEMIQILRPIEDGGILKQRGVVEVVSCIRADGSDVPNPMRWGVYVVITTDSDYLLSCLSDYGVIMDDMGKYGLMYRPYHLVGMEAPISIGKAVIYGESTGAPIMSIGEVVAKAKRNLQVGDLLDGEGGNSVFGELVEKKHSVNNCFLPIGLTDKARVIRSVDEDSSLTYDDVTLPETFVGNLLRLHTDISI